MFDIPSFQNQLFLLVHKVLKVLKPPNSALFSTSFTMKLLSPSTSSVLLLGLLRYSYAQRGNNGNPSEAAPPEVLPNDADPATVDDPLRDGPIRAEPKPNTNVNPEAGSAADDKTVEIGINSTSGSSTVIVEMEEVEGFWGTETKGRKMLEPGLAIYGFEILGGREDEVVCNAIKLIGETGWGKAGTIASVPFGDNLKKPHTDIDAIDCSIP